MRPTLTLGTKNESLNIFPDALSNIFFRCRCPRGDGKIVKSSSNFRYSQDMYLCASN